MSFSDNWVHPRDLLRWQLKLYAAKYNAGISSYQLHYDAACRPWPSRISVERMNFMCQQIAIVRLKGTVIPKGEMTYYVPDDGISWDVYREQSSVPQVLKEPLS